MGSGSSNARGAPIPGGGAAPQQQQTPVPSGGVAPPILPSFAPQQPPPAQPSNLVFNRAPSAATAPMPPQASPHPPPYAANFPANYPYSPSDMRPPSVPSSYGADSMHNTPIGNTPINPPDSSAPPSAYAQAMYPPPPPASGYLSSGNPAGGIEDSGAGRSLNDTQIRDLHYCLDILTEIGADASQLDPTVILAGLEHTNGDVDKALDVILNNPEILQRSTSVASSVDSPTPGPVPLPNPPTMPPMMPPMMPSMPPEDPSGVVDDELALMLAVSASEAHHREQANRSRQDERRIAAMESEVVGLSREQARMEQERNLLDDLALQAAILQSQLETMEEGESKQLRMELVRLQRERAELESNMLHQRAQDRKAEDSAAQVFQEAEKLMRDKDAELAAMSTQMDDLAAAQLKERQAMQEELEKEAKKGAAECERLKAQIQQLSESVSEVSKKSAVEREQLRSELEEQSKESSLLLETQREQYMTVKVELERHKKVSTELAAQRRDYEVSQKELQDRIMVGAQQEARSEERVSALAAECESLREQLAVNSRAASGSQALPSINNSHDICSQDIWANGSLPGSSDHEAIEQMAAQISQLEGELDKERKKLQQRQQQQGRLENDLQAAHAKEMERMKKILEAEAANKKAVRKRADKLAKDLAASKAECSSAEAQLKVLQNEAQSIQSAHSSAARQWNHERAELENTVKTAHDEIAHLRSELAAAKAYQYARQSAFEARNSTPAAADDVDDDSAPIDDISQRTRGLAFKSDATTSVYLPSKYDPSIPGGW